MSAEEAKVNVAKRQTHRRELQMLALYTIILSDQYTQIIAEVGLEANGK